MSPYLSAPMRNWSNWHRQDNSRSITSVNTTTIALLVLFYNQCWLFPLCPLQHISKVLCRLGSGNFSWLDLQMPHCSAVSFRMRAATPLVRISNHVPICNRSTKQGFAIPCWYKQGFLQAFRFSEIMDLSWLKDKFNASRFLFSLFAQAFAAKE
jgi:hypothetical protein